MADALGDVLHSISEISRIGCKLCSRSKRPMFSYGSPYGRSSCSGLGSFLKRQQKHVVDRRPATRRCVRNLINDRQARPATTSQIVADKLRVHS